MKPTITIKIQGGLGNQLFQYAFARKLSLAYGASIKFDASSYSAPLGTLTARAYRLDRFMTAGSVASAKDIALSRPERGAVRSIFGLIKRRGTDTLVEESFAFSEKNLSPLALARGQDLYVEGYFQTERYFKDIRDTLFKDLTFKEAPDRTNRDALAAIAERPSVSVHVRRGDLLSPKHRSMYGTCPLSYYRDAAREMISRVGYVRFFVFSDDIAWARKNLDLGEDVIFVDHNGPDKDYEDLRLMAACEHHIVANSSFSWWGAWLSKNPDKIVIAPSKVFKKKSLDTRDYFPSSWIRIETDLE